MGFQAFSHTNMTDPVSMQHRTHEIDFNLLSDITMNHTSNLKFVLVVHQFLNYIKVRPKDTVDYR